MEIYIYIDLKKFKCFGPVQVRSIGALSTLFYYYYYTSITIIYRYIIIGLFVLL